MGHLPNAHSLARSRRASNTDKLVSRGRRGREAGTGSLGSQAGAESAFEDQGGWFSWASVVFGLEIVPEPGGAEDERCVCLCMCLCVVGARLGPPAEGTFLNGLGRGGRMGSRGGEETSI